ncbi:hypothetical protein BGW80DRAFT_1360633 [Lactifluus volemus]|nr:hypothetical protein BGW80DRAFT_1360633 [Lactifluus volemus]
MPNTFTQDYAPQFAGAVFQVTTQFLGLSIVESIRKQLPRRKVQRGDEYADGARNLLRTNLELMEPADQAKIKTLLQLVVTDKQKVEYGDGSRFQRILQARAYKCSSKELYIVVKSASDRAVNETLLTQMRRALGETEFNSENPFADPSRAPSLTASSVYSLHSVELETYEDESTGDVAVGLTMRREDETTEEVLAQIPADREEHGAQEIAIIPLSGDSALDTPRT